jgi:hypothetical protein
LFSSSTLAFSSSTSSALSFPAISIRQPWADLIVRGIKDIENRSWPTTFRGNILIQAGQKIERDALCGRILVDLGITSAEDYHPDTMAIIGMVEITDCVTPEPILQRVARVRAPACGQIPHPNSLPRAAGRLPGADRPINFIEIPGRVARARDPNSGSPISIQIPR